MNWNPTNQVKGKGRQCLQEPSNCLNVLGRWLFLNGIVWLEHWLSFSQHKHATSAGLPQPGLPKIISHKGGLMCQCIYNTNRFSIWPNVKYGLNVSFLFGIIAKKCVFAEHYDVTDKATFDPSEIKLYPFNRSGMFCQVLSVYSV